LKFHDGPWPPGGQSGRGCAVIFYDDQYEMYCSLYAEADSIKSWESSWRNFLDTDIERLKWLLSHVDEFEDIDEQLATEQRDASSQKTLLQALFGLLAVLRTGATWTIDNKLCETASQEIKHYLDGRYAVRRLTGEERRAFGIRPDHDSEIAVVFIGPSVLLDTNPGNAPDPAPLTLFGESSKGARSDSSLVPVAGPNWQIHLFQSEVRPDGQGSRFVAAVIDRYEFLVAAARIEQSDFVWGSFLSFSAVLVEHAETNERYLSNRPFLVPIYRLLVLESPDLDVARNSLRRLLRRKVAPESQWQLIKELIAEMRPGPNRDWQPGAGPPAGQQQALVTYPTSIQRSPDRANEDDRSAMLIGNIVDHFLERYHLDCAHEVWKQLGPRSLTLKAIMSFLGNPWGVLRWYLLGFVALMWMATVAPRLAPGSTGSMVISVLGALFLLLLYIIPLITIWFGVVSRGAFARRLYTQLLLPRLLGAIIVGLLALVLDDLPFKLGLLTPPLNWLLLVLGVFAFSYFYILSEVQRAMRFEPWSQWIKAIRINQPQSTSTFQHAHRMAWRVFALGLVQALLVAIPLSGLTASVPLTQDLWRNSFLGALEWRFYAFDFMLVPNLVIMWAGLALFVGSFVQLLWQDRYLTSPFPE
jgi:hypothetical protein